jgi:hypothetical protein
MEKLDLNKTIYIIRGSVMDGSNESVINNHGDYLSNDPTGGLEGVFEYDQEAEDFEDQESYDNHLIDLHVSIADGEIRQDKFENNWYLDGNQWLTINDDGELNFDNRANSPDDLDGLEEKPYSSYEQWRKTVHVSWLSNSDYKAIIEHCNKYHTQFAPEGMLDLINSRDWTLQNPDVHVDLTPRILGSGVELIRLTDAVSRGVARFVLHRGVPVLEVRHYDFGRPQWSDVHTFRSGATQYQNVSAANLPYTYDNTEVNSIIPDNINNWFVGYQLGIPANWSSRVVWTISPLGLDYTSGGQDNCSLDIAAYVVGAIQ